ncbi:MAG: hypothetical protein JWQ09_4522 [Segetibacter sp.]|nr:hypothetical protein [Segetibacter sp.]
MKKNLLFIFIFFATVSFAQPVRLHIMGGFANYNGDLQQKRFTLSQAKGVVSAGATFNITDQLSVRSDYSFAHLAADDKKSSKPDLRARNLNFNTYIYELTLLGEYDIVNLNQHKLSPYVFGGVGVFHFSPSTYDAVGRKIYLAGLSTEGQGFLPGKKEYKKTQLNIPMGGGIKYALSDDIHIGFELGLRVLKTDYLDDVSSAYVDRNKLLAARGQRAVDFAFRGDELKNNPSSYPAGGTLRGNSKVNDFYYFGLFRIDFRMNWFDNDANGRRRGLQCPTKL